MAELELVGVVFSPPFVVTHMGVGNFETILPLPLALPVSHNVHPVFLHVLAPLLNAFPLELHILRIG